MYLFFDSYEITQQQITDKIRALLDFLDEGMTSGELLHKNDIQEQIDRWCNEFILHHKPYSNNIYQIVSEFKKEGKIPDLSSSFTATTTGEIE